MRPIIARAAKRSFVPGQSAAPRPRCVIWVRTNPGATAFTVMPCWPNSRAKRRVRIATSALRRRVECVAGQRGADRRDRAHIDDPPLAPRPHAPYHCPGGMDYAIHINSATCSCS
jgi:hypothetical protein